MKKWGEKQTKNEIKIAADELRKAYDRFNNAIGYKQVKAACYELRAAELKLGDAVDCAKQSIQGLTLIEGRGKNEQI